MDCIKKSSTVLISIKVLLSLFITYLIVFKGDAGTLVYSIGSFLVGGNYIVGLFSLASATLLYILAMYNLTVNYKSLIKLKQILLVFDICLVIISLLLGTFIASAVNKMVYADAISKFVILTTGAAIVYYITSLIVVLLLPKIQKIEDNTPLDCLTNNNPVTFTGRIERLPYLITKICTLVIFLINLFIIKFFSQLEYTVIFIVITLFIYFLVGLFAASKRLRDIKWSQWLLLIWIIPFFGLIIGLPLLFVKGKYTNSEEIVEKGE